MKTCTRRCLMPFDAPTTPLGQLWHDALKDLVLRHPDPQVWCELWLRDSAMPCSEMAGIPAGRVLLEVVSSNVRDSRTMDERFFKLTVSTTQLMFFPGKTLARMWLACAWAGYVMHETLELASVGDDLDERVLDPHTPNMCGLALQLHDDVAGQAFAHDRALRDGFPAHLTRESMQDALAVCMGQEGARSIIRKYSAELVPF